jgi:hypothetical protein
MSKTVTLTDHPQSDTAYRAIRNELAGVGQITGTIVGWVVMRYCIVVAIALLVASCGPPAVYSPPPTASTTSFSRELNASYDTVWSAVTNVAGATFFSIKNFDKGSGLMTLDYANLRNVGPYVECGTVSGGLQLGTFPGISPNSVLNYSTAKRISLSGTGNITIRSMGPRRTLIQVNSLYTLAAFGVDANNVPVQLAVWRFTTREPDTQTLAVNFMPRPVTCRPSYKLEEDFLTEVSARL